MLFEEPKIRSVTTFAAPGWDYLRIGATKP